MWSCDKVGGQTETKSANFVGLSTDTKPTEGYIPNGSTFLEIDTLEVFFYDEENKEWINS